MNSNSAVEETEMSQFIGKIDELKLYLKGIGQTEIADIIQSELNTIKKIITAYYPKGKKASPDFKGDIDQVPKLALMHNSPSHALPIRQGQIKKGKPYSNQKKDISSDITATEPKTSAELEVFMFGEFNVYQDSFAVKHCSNYKAKQLLKYLVLHRGTPTHKEVLMELLWPQLSAKAARNNLNVSICALRNSLPCLSSGLSHIIYQSDCYSINPNIDIRVDVEMFDEALSRAAMACRNNDEVAAMGAYQLAVELYQGELLTEDRYDEWIQPLRQKNTENYLYALRYLLNRYTETGDLENEIATCLEILATDPLEETALKYLMCSYRKAGKRHLAIRAYQEYEKQLLEELDLVPDGKMQALLADIKCGEFPRAV